MCGIAGIVNLSRQPIDLGLLAAMNSAMRHRGPDDEGYVVIKQGSEGSVQFSGQESPADVRDRYPLLDSSQNRTEGNIGLAHRRYAIIDLTSGGHQPFFDHHRQCCVVFNGEIYNYVEVREELESRGSVFHTDSDTEAIVEGYKAWGTECFKHLNGMWALALYDFRRHTLLLSRDRMGKRPLYWTRVENTIVFASEIKALFQVPAIERTRALNEAVAYPYLTRGLRDLDDTTFLPGFLPFRREPGRQWMATFLETPNATGRFRTSVSKSVIFQSRRRLRRFENDSQRPYEFASEPTYPGRYNSAVGWTPLPWLPWPLN